MRLGLPWVPTRDGNFYVSFPVERQDFFRPGRVNVHGFFSVWFDSHRDGGSLHRHSLSLPFVLR